MKLNKNNKRQSFTFLTLLSFCAIATSTAITAIEPLSRKEAFSPTTVEQSEKQDRQKPFEPIGRNSDETWEEIHLGREWEDILGDDPEQGVLMADFGF